MTVQATILPGPVRQHPPLPVATAYRFRDGLFASLESHAGAKAAGSLERA